MTYKRFSLSTLHRKRQLKKRILCGLLLFSLPVLWYFTTPTHNSAGDAGSEENAVAVNGDATDGNAVEKVSKNEDAANGDAGSKSDFAEPSGKASAGASGADGALSDGTKNRTNRTASAKTKHSAKKAKKKKKAAFKKLPALTDSWALLLINPWNKIPDNHSVELTPIEYGHSIDSRAHADLQQMLADCRAAGLFPLICSSYRTTEKQQALYQSKINRLITEGCAPAAAETEAAKVVAIPGYSEHQTGLALDIVDATHQALNTTQETTRVQKWLMTHSWKYGFVLRYPNGKSDITGIIYEPWHYRYVGKAAAKEMKDLDVCLEEYLEILKEE